MSFQSLCGGCWAPEDGLDVVSEETRSMGEGVVLYPAELSSSWTSDMISFNATSTGGSLGFRTHLACLTMKVFPCPKSLPVMLIFEESSKTSGDDDRKPRSRLVTWQTNDAKDPRGSLTLASRTWLAVSSGGRDGTSVTAP